MKTVDPLEKKIKKNTQRLSDLIAEIDSVDQAAETLLDDLQLKKDQLSNFSQKPKQVSDENWKSLEKIKKNLDQKLKTDLDNITNPRKVKKTYIEKRISRNWIFVR